MSSSGSNTVRTVHIRAKYEQVHELSFNERVQAQHCMPDSKFTTLGLFFISS